MELFATSQVQNVATWAGLIIGISGVVLALVAIYFTIEVDRRSARTAAETIKTLERISEAVRSQSHDTRDLIKFGWERMFANVSTPSVGTSTSDQGVREVAAGLAAEIRADLGIDDQDEAGEPASMDARLAALNESLDQLQSTLETQLRAPRWEPGEEVQFWVEMVSELSDEAQAVARVIASVHSHITRDQMRRLQRDNGLVGEALTELRSDGFLVPLEGRDRERRKTVVYFFPPDMMRAIRAALLMTPELDPVFEEDIMSTFQSVGYPDKPPSPDKR